MKNIVATISIMAFIFALFFNVSLTQDQNGDNSLSLKSLQTAQAMDEETECYEEIEIEEYPCPIFYECCGFVMRTCEREIVVSYSC